MRHMRKINESNNSNISSQDMLKLFSEHIENVGSETIIDDFLPALIEKVDVDTLIDVIKSVEDLFYTFVFIVYEKNGLEGAKKYINMPEFKNSIMDFASECAYANDYDMVKYLFSLGPNPNSELYDGENILFGIKEPKMIKYLLSVGVFIDHINKSGETPLCKLSEYTEKGKDSDAIITLLENGANPILKGTSKVLNFIENVFLIDRRTGDMLIKIDEDVIVALVENNPDVFNQIKEFLVTDSIKKRLDVYFDSEDLGLL